jgi:hypothetical protein
MTFESIYEPLREHVGHSLEIQVVDIEDDTVILFCDTCGVILADILDGIRLRGRRRPADSDCELCGRPEVSYCPDCEGEIRMGGGVPLLQ